MPSRAPRICPHCHEASVGRCPCRAEAGHRYDRDRGQDRQFYSTQRWRRFRKRFLAKNPYCVHCASYEWTDTAHLSAGPNWHRFVLATVVDHIIPRSERRDLAYNAENCRGLCVSCHNRRTRKQEQEHGCESA